MTLRNVAALSAALAMAGAAAGGAASAGESRKSSPVTVRSISMISLGKPGFDSRGRRAPRKPTRVIPYEGTFKLTMDVERIEPGVSIKWMAWFGRIVRKGYIETDDAKAYRAKESPPTVPVTTIRGFGDRFRGRPARAAARPGETVRPSPDKPGEAYSFHPDPMGHNSALYPLWMRPVRRGENVLYGLVHQRFVYHIMFRIAKDHFAPYDLETQAARVARMTLPYTVILVADDGEQKRLVAVYAGEVPVSAFPVDDLRRGAGVTVEKLVTTPRRIWPPADRPAN